MTRRLAQAGLALLAGLALAYAVAEVRLRLSVVLPAEPAAYLYAWPPLYDARAGVSRRVPGLAPREVRVTADAVGLRGDELPEDEDVFRILTLGGSTTECLLLADADTWPQRLQRNLGQRSGRRVWVGNAARSGHMSLDYIAQVRLLVPQIRPDLVLVLIGANDVQAAAEDRLLALDLRQREVLVRYAAQLFEAPDPAVFDALEPSYTLFFLRRRLAGGERLDFADLYERMKERRFRAPKQDVIPALADHLDAFRANLDLLAESAAEQPGTRIVLLTHPHLLREEMPEEEVRTLWAGYSCLACDDPTYYSRRAMIEALDLFSDAVLDACSRYGISCLDLEPAIAKNLDNFYDDAHLTEAGADRVSDAVAGFLVDEGVIR